MWEHQVELNDNSDDKIQSSSSAGTKKQRKRMHGNLIPSETSSKNDGRNLARGLNSSSVNGNLMTNVVPLSREERKNEQIIRMIER